MPSAARSDDGLAGKELEHLIRAVAFGKENRHMPTDEKEQFVAVGMHLAFVGSGTGHHGRAHRGLVDSRRCPVEEDRKPRDRNGRRQTALRREPPRGRGTREVLLRRSTRGARVEPSRPLVAQSGSRRESGYSASREAVRMSPARARRPEIGRRSDLDVTRALPGALKKTRRVWQRWPRWK